MTLALLRAIKTTGHVLYDSIDIERINLDSLRSAVSLIPQQAELLKGTLRENLDPFRVHEDAALNEALKTTGLWDLQKKVNSYFFLDNPSQEFQLLTFTFIS